MDEIDLSELENPNLIPEAEEPDNPFESEEPQKQDFSAEDPDKRAKKMLTLQFYFNQFPDKLVMYQGVQLHQLSCEQLDSLQNEVNLIVNAQSTIQQSINTFKCGLVFLESVLINHSPIKAQGLSALAQDKVLLDNVKIWTLENIEIVKSKPEHRIAMRVAGAILSLHNSNSNLAAQRDINELNNKFSDL